MGYGPAIAAALAGAGGPPPDAAAPPSLPMPPAVGAPPMMGPPPGAMPGMPPPVPTAQGLHEAQSKKFLHAAITDFHRGGITRGQLADAVADQDAYDYDAWKRMNVTHPSRATSHNVPAEEAPPSLPGGMA